MQQPGVAAAIAAYGVTDRLATVHTRIASPKHSRWQRGTKRGFDIIVSAGLLIALSPLLAILALLVRWTSRGPAIFAHSRVGRGGQPFRFYKFRSMVANAEARKIELVHLNEMQGAAFKISHDPRITPLGRVLRKYSLDELPQLWNVLIGDMSLVGPRPPTPAEVLVYTPRQLQRLSVTPGITGLWQVSGRSKLTSFEQWVELDLAYITQWSLWFDIQILARTLPAVLRAEGSC